MAAWSRRARLNRLSDRLRRQSVAASTPAVPCAHCGEICGTETIHQGGETFRSDACARADVAYLETSR